MLRSAQPFDMPSDDDLLQTDTPQSPDQSQLGINGNTPSRRRTTQACDRCRSRKIRCDAKLPQCNACAYSNVNCTYDMPKKRRGPKTRAQRLEAQREKELELARQPISTPDDSNSTTPVCEPSVVLSNATAPSVHSAPSIPGAPISPPVPSISGHPVHEGEGAPPLSRPIMVIARNLVKEISASGLPFRDLLFQSLGLYHTYIFPLVPIVDIPSLELDADALWAEIISAADVDPVLIGPEEIASVTALDQAFTLLTAVCAYTTYMIPPEINPHGTLIAPMLLRASRKALATYAETDLENPSSLSVVIRYLHSGSFHATGKPRASWYTLGESIRICQSLQMHRDSSYIDLPEKETQMRRRIFWILYTADKSAAFLSNNSICHEDLLFHDISIPYPDEQAQRRFSQHSTGETPNTVESRSIITGFNYNQKLWRLAHELLLDIAILKRRRRDGMLAADMEYTKLNEKYISFLTCLDEAPPWLQSPVPASVTADGEDKRFGIQRANLYVSFHCIRMKITKELHDLSIENLGESNFSIGGYAVRVTEIARDMIQVICTVPLLYLKINGESCVEKIRLIGVNLLELIHREPTSALGRRAKADISTLLNILAQLDSKALDSLFPGP